MNNRLPSAPAVPSIHIQEPDDSSALFEGGEMFPADMYCLYPFDADLYQCSRGLQSEHISNSFPSSPSELEEMTELPHLTTTNHPYFTGHGFAYPYAILQENGATALPDLGLSPSSLGSPAHSPASYTSSLSPSSIYDSIPLSDSESPVSPSPATPDQQFPWSAQGFSNQSSDSLVSQPLMGSLPNDSILPPGSLGPATHRRSKSSPSARREPVASKAMLEANSRRRRHPAQFQCEDCGQTFTALFSLKRHAQSHTGERPFQCGIPGCPQRFYNSSDCKRHEKSRKRHKELMMQ